LVIGALGTFSKKSLNLVPKQQMKQNTKQLSLHAFFKAGFTWDKINADKNCILL
jgi:hypothetical protein